MNLIRTKSLWVCALVLALIEWRFPFLLKEPQDKTNTAPRLVHTERSLARGFQEGFWGRANT